MSREVLTSTFADRDFHDATFHKVLGHAEVDGRGVERTPLNVPFREGWVTQSSVLSHKEMLDAEVFNAVGSLVRPSVAGSRHHLPVIDVYGGAYVQYSPGGDTEAVLKTYSRYPGWGSTDQLTELLKPHGIGIESSQRTSRLPIGSIALRHTRSDVFGVVPSTTEGRSHLYLNTLLDDEEHKVLIEGLLGAFVVTPPWADLVEKEQMGVVRTPWTRKVCETI